MAAPKKRVLVVDDNDSTRKLLVAVLGRNPKLEIEAVANATDALKSVIASKPAVIVLDMMLPEMSGMEFIDQLHKELTGALPPIIAITAAPEVAAPDSIIRAADRKVVRSVFRKPFDQAKLAAAVAESAGV